MDARGKMGLHRGDDRGLDRADIGDDGAGLERAGNGPGDGAVGADGNAQDDAIGVAHGLGRVGVIAVAEGEFLGAAERLGAARRNGDVAREVPPPRGKRDRRADQADADQRQALEDGLAHQAGFFPRNAPSAAITASLASSEPMVMRSALGRP